MECPGCGNEFEPTREWQRYCTKKCREKASNDRRQARIKKAMKKFDASTESLDSGK